MQGSTGKFLEGTRFGFVGNQNEHHICWGPVLTPAQTFVAQDRVFHPERLAALIRASGFIGCWPNQALAPVTNSKLIDRRAPFIFIFLSGVRFCAGNIQSDQGSRSTHDLPPHCHWLVSCSPRSWEGCETSCPFSRSRQGITCVAYAGKQNAGC